MKSIPEKVLMLRTQQRKIQTEIPILMELNYNEGNPISKKIRKIYIC